MRGQLPKAANHNTSGLREVGLALVTAGLVVLLFVVYELVGTNLSEEHSQARLARDFNAALASVPGPVAPSATTTTTLAPRPKGIATSPPVAKAIGSRTVWKATAARPGQAVDDPKGPTGALPVTPPGGALDHLVIPVIGVDRYVVEGVAEADLQMGPGHYPGTPLPGQVGNVAIAGHRTTFGAPFFRLNEVHTGDLIYLTDTLGTTWVYRVVRQFVVPPTDVAVLDATRAPELTLTTCNPRFEATSRLVVRAALLTHLARGTRVPEPLPVEATGDGRFPAVGGRPASVPRRLHASQDISKPTSHVSRHVPSKGRTAASASPLRSAPATSVPASSTVPTTGTTSATTTDGGGSASVRGGGDSPVIGAGPGPAALSASQTGSSTGGAAAGALGWGIVALAAWVATRIVAARRRRYYKVGVLLGGALACLVPLWFAFGSVVDLLPANI